MKIKDYYKKIPLPAKASFWYVICSVLQKLVAFATTPIYTRLMTTEHYGQVTIYDSWLEIFTIFATLNLFYGVYNNVLTKYPDDREVATSSMQGLCTTITVVMLVIYCIFREPINKLSGMNTVMTFLLFIEVLFVPAYRFWLTKKRFQYEYKPVLIASLVISVLTAALGVPVVLLSTEKGIARIVTSVIAQLVVAVIIYFYIFKSGKCFFNKRYWKYALTFNIPLIPHYLSATILNQSDRVMIDRMCGTDKAGIYGLAYTIGTLVIIVNQAITNSYTPYIYQNLKKESYEKIQKTTNGLVIVIAVVTLILVSFAPELIWTMGGDQYREGVWIIAPIAASIFFRFLYSMYATIEFYHEDNYFVMIASVICAVLNIILNYVFIKMFGYLAAGYTTLASFAIYSFMHYLFSNTVLKKHGIASKVFDNRFILTLSLALIICCLGIGLLYKCYALRYMLIAVMMAMAVVFRKQIILLFKGLKE